MAISNPKASGNTKKTGANSAKDTLDWRIKELRAFDVSRIQDRWDPVLESLHKSVNEALAEVLGSHTPDYRKFAIETFDATLPSDFGGRYSTDELQRAVQDSVAQAIVTLDRVKALVRERARQQPATPTPPPAPVAAPAAPVAAPTPVTTPPVTAAPVPVPAAPKPAPTPAAPPPVAPPPATAPAAVKTPAAPPVSAAPVAATAPVPARPAVTPPPQAAAAPAPAPVKPAAAPAAPVQPAPTPAPAPSPVAAPPAAQAQAPVPTTATPTRVRVAVIGGEAQARRAVLDFVVQLGLQPASAAAPQAEADLFLDRLDELRDLQYAVVLLPVQSLDPASGAPSAVAPELLMELGHVLATVGRSRACFLLNGAGKPPVWQGIGNLRFDDEGLWHLLLARAMKQAGLDVDLNRAV